MDIEEPEPADPFPAIIAPLVEDAPDPDEVQQDLLACECRRQADLSAAYWLTLREARIPARECTALTQEWMEICAWPAEED